MGVITGLTAIRSTLKDRSSGIESLKYSDRELTRNIAKNGERTIRFIQELDESSPLYDEKYGLGIVAVEYEHPNLYWLKLADSFDTDGDCWPAEQGWEQRISLYINVVDTETGEVFYLSRSILGGLGQQVIESASDRGTLTDGVWKIKKTGEGMKTRYALNLISISNDKIDVSTENLVELKSLINEVPYAEQERFVRNIEQRVQAKAQASDDAQEVDVW